MLKAGETYGYEMMRQSGIANFEYMGGEGASSPECFLIYSLNRTKRADHYTEEAMVLLPTLNGIGGTEGGVHFHWHESGGFFFAPTGPLKKHSRCIGRSSFETCP